jgi:hypothetical protein
VGKLTTRAALEFRGSEREQVRAWEAEVQLLRSALSDVPGSDAWGIVLEYSLRRLALRPDAVLLAPGVIVVIEFKMSAARYQHADSRQVENYALCIRDFHALARTFQIVPIVCAQNAPDGELLALTLIDRVSEVLTANERTLARAVRTAASAGAAGARALGWRDFDAGAYNPTPTIVEKCPQRTSASCRGTHRHGTIANPKAADTARRSALKRDGHSFKATGSPNRMAQQRSLAAH